MDLDYFMVADQRFYEPIDRKVADEADFLGLVSPKLDDGWRIARKGVWTNCVRRDDKAPDQGWKIHVSSIPRHAQRLLETVSAYLIDRNISFKFICDLKTLRLTNIKGWARSASGKFITIYPIDEDQFKRILKDLDPLTRGFKGPYILSDRRYKDSRVLYYRYGGLRMRSRLLADGMRLATLTGPDGREIEDVRGPSFQVPDWTADPFPRPEEPESGGLNNGRYAIESAIHFSNTGGVYLALDSTTGKRVILKEARADVYVFTGDEDAAAMLDHEFSMLTRIEDAGVAPRPIELFQEWEHRFLVEEYLEDYISLRSFAARGSAGTGTPTRDDVAALLARDLGIVRKIAGIVDAMHERGVVWGDVSVNNVMIHPDTLDVKIIDLESARLKGDASLPRVVTRGFGDKKPGTAPADPEDDYYGVGAVMLFLLTHVNPLLHLKPGAWREALAERERDFGFPPEIAAALEQLLSEEGARRPKASQALDALMPALNRIGRIGLADADWSRRLPTEKLTQTCRDACRFAKANADLHRKDRLFPADPIVYQTNPVSLAHGAAGVIYALKSAEGSVDGKLADWLIKSEASADDIPPGLYTGRAGVAWTLLELGLKDEAVAVLKRTEAHPLLAESADLYQGLAGWGLTNLRFWRATGERNYLDLAEEAGRRLLASAESGEHGLSWPLADGTVAYGLGHGASGVALFLLYLDRTLGGGFAEAARRALDFDLSHATETPWGTLSWKRTSSEGRIVYPYWKAGSAGVGVALLRFQRAFGSSRYREAFEKIYMECDRKYTVFPGRDQGLAGIGEFHLDAFAFTGEPRFLESARKIAAGLELFRVEQPEGAAYPGDGLARLSCDLATGSSGVILFLDRLVRGNRAHFMLDEILE